MRWRASNWPFPKIPIDGPELERRQERARRLLDRALELEPENARALGLRAFHFGGDINDRLAMLERATRLDPGDVTLLRYRGTLALTNGYSSDALDALEAVAQMDPLRLNASMAHDLAIEMGQRDRAAAIMAKLKSIVSHKSELTILSALEARADRDLSRSFALLSRVEPFDNPGAHGRARFHLVGVLAYLDVMEEFGNDMVGENEYYARGFAGDFPDKRGMEQYGIDTRRFWNDPFTRSYAPIAYVGNGQQEILIEFYDDFAKSAQELVSKLPDGRFDFHATAPYTSLSPCVSWGVRTKRRMCCGLQTRSTKKFLPRVHRGCRLLSGALN